MNQPTKPDSDFLPLPKTEHSIDTYHPDGKVSSEDGYTADQVRAAILADRTARQPVAPAEQQEGFVLPPMRGTDSQHDAGGYVLQEHEVAGIMRKWDSTSNSRYELCRAVESEVAARFRATGRNAQPASALIAPAAQIAYSDGLEAAAAILDRKYQAKFATPWAQEIRALKVAPAAPSDAESYDLPLGYFSQNGGTTYVEVDPKFKGEPDVIPLYTHPAPRDVDAPIVLPTDLHKHLRNTADQFGKLGSTTLFTSQVIAAADEIERHYSGMLAWKALADKAIAVLQAHIVPDGISDRDALINLYGIFDGPEYRAALKSTTYATAAVQNDRANWKETK